MSVASAKARKSAPLRPVRLGEPRAVVDRKADGTLLIRTAEPLAGRSRFKGEVTEARANELSVSVDGAHVDIPYESIVRGNLIDERV